MLENAEQHEAFQKGLEALRDYSIQVRSSPSTYDGNKVIALIESFGDTFCHHLHAEIDTLEPEKLRAIFPDQDDLKKTHMEMVKYKIAHATKMTILPWVCPKVSETLIARY